MLIINNKNIDVLERYVNFDLFEMFFAVNWYLLFSKHNESWIIFGKTFGLEWTITDLITESLQPLTVVAINFTL